MKPKQLDLKDIRNWRSSIDPDRCFSLNQIDFIKDCIKSACEFLMKYKDNVKDFSEDYPDEFKKFVQKYSKNYRDFNEWLFRLAFGDVLEAKE